MKTLIAAMVLAFAATATAEQTNALETLQRAQEKQQQSVLEQYGKALDTIMADLKKKGDLDNVLFLQAEQKRFEEEKTVPAPKDAKDSFRPAAEAYFKSMVTLLGQYKKALDELIKQEVTADRIEEAKLVKAEKDKADFMLADMQAKLPLAKAPKKAGTVRTNAGRRSLPDEMRRGLVLHFTFDANDGDTVIDMSDNHLDGTVSGAKWLSEAGRGGCYRFDGKEDHICVPHSDALSFDRTISMSLWLKMEGKGQSAFLMEKWVNGLEDKALYTYATKDKGGFAGCLWGVGNVAFESHLMTASWCHVVLTYDGIELKMYVGSLLMGSAKMSGTIRNATGNLYIGSSRGRATEGCLETKDFKGLIDDVMVYKRALSASEVKELHELQK